METYDVPTGHICIIEGEHGPLEFLSLGDYGKDVNLKADFLGLKKEISGVDHQQMMPLEKKWVITISSQYGCSMDCTFCDVPKVGPGRNATFADISAQVHGALGLHPEVKTAARINLHYARMGEPTFNRSVITSAITFNQFFSRRGWGFHPVISTMMPRKNRYLKSFLVQWMEIKNNVMNGNAGLQISVNTTDEYARSKMFGGNACTMLEIADIIGDFQPAGRKITLNIALTDAPVDAHFLYQLFDPGRFLVKITPMHKTRACVDGCILTGSDENEHGYRGYYPYKKIEESLKKEGFDVIVFVPSREEDESRITCGNAILSDFSRLQP